MNKVSKRLLLIFVVLVAAAFIVPTIANATFHRKIDSDNIGPCAVTGFYCTRNGVKIFACHPRECDSYKREEPQKLCEKYGITFPVKDLGNCPNYAACRQYCQDPLNQGKCLQFGNSKGISPKEVVEQDIRLGFKDSLIKLPCESTGSCKTFCDQSQNYDKCNEFAQANKLVGGYIDNPANDQIIGKAEEVLGCSSPGECASFCTKPENQQKCSGFSQNVGLAGGERKVGPGGCTTSETCKTFCQDSDNQKKYPGCSIDIRKEPPFPYKDIERSVNPLGGSVDSQNPGPGGCTSDQACQSYCDDSKNKEECSKYQWSGPGGCTDQASCSSYCQKNYQDPDCSKYGGGQGGGDYGNYKEQLQQYEQQKQQNLQQFQQMEGQKQLKQQEYDQGQQQYDAKQQEYNQMQNSGEYQQKMQQYQQMQGQYDQKQQEYNQMQQSQPQAPTQGVQGVTTTRGLLQLILDALFKR